MATSTSFDAAFARAFALHQEGRLREAFEAYSAIIAASPAHAPAWHYSGLVLYQCGESAAAVPRIERAVALDPQSADAWSNLALAYQSLGRQQQAIGALQQARTRAPADGVILENLAGALLDAGETEQAESIARQAVGADAKSPGAWYNLTLVLRQQQRSEEALVAATRGLASARANTQNAHPLLIPLLGLKSTLEETPTSSTAALATLKAALGEHPDATALQKQLGSLLERTGDLAAAARAFEAIREDPDGTALSQLIFLRKRLSDWHDLTILRKRFIAGVAAGVPLLSPFCLLSEPSSRAMQRQCAQTWVRTLESEIGPRQELRQSTPARRNPGDDRLKIGFLSADFHTHATALLIVGLFERFDRTRFNVLAYSTGPDDASALRKRVVCAFDRFVDAHNWPSLKVAAQIRADGVDILVDLKGHTDGAPMAVLAHRPAPVQVAYLGYPATSGASFIDYLIGDAIVTPLSHADDYSETLVQLPGCYQVNDSDRPITAPPSRAALGLPEHAVVLCCFNDPYKINPEVFEAWMAILKSCTHAVLWLLARNVDDPVIVNLRAEAVTRGVAPERLVFALRRSNAAYLGLYRHAAIFLDTWPYNGHTTASDALWSGCPVLTTLGGTFAGRVAASLLHAVGLPQLVARDPAHYVTLALQLIDDPGRCAALRAHLESSGRRSSLFDTEASTRALERALIAIAAQHRAGISRPIVLEPQR